MGAVPYNGAETTPRFSFLNPEDGVIVRKYKNGLGDLFMAWLSRLVCRLLPLLMLCIAPGLAAEPFTIGLNLGQTGALAPNGKAALLAMQIWVEDTNAKGGLLGRPVKLITYDDQSNPALVPGIISKLLDVDHVDILIAGNGTNMVAPALPVAIQRKLTLVGLFGLDVNQRVSLSELLLDYSGWGRAAEGSVRERVFCRSGHGEPEAEDHRPGRRRCGICPQCGGWRPCPGQAGRLQDRLRQYLSAQHGGLLADHPRDSGHQPRYGFRWLLSPRYRRHDSRRQ